MRTRPILLCTLLGALPFLTMACHRPAPLQASRPVEAVAPNTGDDEARRQAGEAARKEEEAAIQAQRMAMADAERQAAFKGAAERALVDVHFGYDRSDVLPKDKPVLQGIADFLRTYPAARIQVQGNCDERGTTEYNLSLGERRASAVRDYLAGLGVDPARLEVLSYGKEKPVCEEHTEDCWYRNRRAHFFLK